MNEPPPRVLARRHHEARHRAKLAIASSAAITSEMCTGTRWRADPLKPNQVDDDQEDQYAADNHQNSQLESSADWLKNRQIIAIELSLLPPLSVMAAPLASAEVPFDEMEKLVVASAARAAAAA